jgi:hypothetical protein
MKQKIFLTAKLPLILFFFSLIVLGGCSSSTQLTSTWQNQDIKIDGNASDWKMDLQSIKDQNITVGFKNDSHFLYLCLITNDMSKISQLMRSGLIVWFEPANSSYKTYGLKYPLTQEFNDQPPTGQMNKDKSTRENSQRGNAQKDNMPKNNPSGENLGKMIETFFQKQLEMEILNEEKFPLTTITIQNKEGVEAKFGEYKGMLAYELRVPLAVEGDYSFKAGAVPGDKIKIRFETETADNNKMRGGESMPQGSGQGPGGGGQAPGGGGQGPGGGGMPGGGMSGGGGMPGGGGKPGGSNSGMSKSSSLNYTIELTLVKEQAKTK